MSTLTVTIDAGHDATNVNQGPGGLYEHATVLEIAIICKRYLESFGHNVVMTRTGGEAVTLADRLAIARKARSDCFVSIHTNAADEGAAHGYESFYSAHNPKSKLLSDAIVKQLAYTGRHSRGSKIKLSTDGSGADYYDLHNYAKGLPVALVECEFHTNVEAEAWLKTSEAKVALAYQIAKGINDYAATLLMLGEGGGNGGVAKVEAVGSIVYKGTVIAQGVPIVGGKMMVGDCPLRAFVSAFGRKVERYDEATKTAHLVDNRSIDFNELENALAQTELAVQNIRKEVEKL